MFTYVCTLVVCLFELYYQLFFYIFVKQILFYKKLIKHIVRYSLK